MTCGFVEFVFDRVGRDEFDVGVDDLRRVTPRHDAVPRVRLKHEREQVAQLFVACALRLCLGFVGHDGGGACRRVRQRYVKIGLAYCARNSMSVASPSTMQITTAPARAVSLNWIIGARADLVWFIGSVASSYLLLALYVTGLVPLLPLVFLWAVLIDAPHVFGTFSRTYFDRAERRARARLLWGSLAFFAVGPLMVLAGFGLVFFFLAALWAYYHLVKQHYGFMVLYKKKNYDLAPADNFLDRMFLL